MRPCAGPADQDTLGRIRTSGLLAVLALALATRLVVVAASGASTVSFPDGPDYVAHMRQLCEQGTYPDRGYLPFFRAPGLPLFLALVTCCDARSIAIMRVALALSGVVGVAAVFWLAHVLQGRKAAGLAALAAAVWPPLIVQDTDVCSEALFTPLLTLALATVLHGLARGSAPLLGAAGILAALASLTRPAALALLPFFAASCLCRRAPSAGRRLLLSASFVAAAVATLAPWTYRNHARYGELIVVNDAAPHSLWWGSHPLLTRPSGRSFEEHSREFGKEVAAVGADVYAREATPSGRRRAWLAMWRENVRADVPAYVRYTLRKALSYWRPWLDPEVHGGPAVLGSALLIVPLYAASLAGLRELWRSRRWEAWFVAGFLIVGWLAHVPHHVVMRLRIPFTDPLFLALTGIAVERGLGRSARP